MRYPVNRVCPITGEAPARVLGHIPAGLIGAANETYRPEALAILNLQPEDEFPLVESAAGVVFAGWLPDEAFLRRLYDEAIDHTKSSSEALWYRRFLWEMGSGLLAVREQMGPPKDAMKLLDFGCGYGGLLRLLNGREVTAVGYEPSLARHERSSASVDILDDLCKVSARGPFDLLVCTEVLEHTPEPRQALKFMRRNAARDALLLVTVPLCTRSFVTTALEGFAAGRPQSLVFNPWEHLNYFSDQDLRRLLREEGFEPIVDLGRAQAAHRALTKPGAMSLLRLAVNALRVGKRMLAEPWSTQLVCRCA